MRIAWFTPFRTNSAIGQVSKLVCEELQKTCNVEIYTSGNGDIISSFVPVTKFKGQNFDIHRLEKYDFVVYNMGNYAGNHKEIWEVLQRYPGIVLLHDQIMHNFFSQINLIPEFGGNPDSGEKSYLDLMTHYHGAKGNSCGKAVYPPYFGERKVRLWDSEAAIAYPFLEPLLENAIAVFTHANFFVKKLKDFFYGPMEYAYLPYIPIIETNNTAIPSEFLDGTKALVVSNGIVHPVKRIDRITQMLLANQDLAKKINYVVIGGFGGAYGDYLHSLAKGPLKGCLYLLGYQPDDIMAAFLQKADFCINMRFPNSEVCSKSLIEQMAYKNPVIVLNSGIFSEIPNDCVVKIKLENEISDLEKAFRHLLSDQNLRTEIGNNAANFVKQNCTPEEYIRKLKILLASIPETIAANRIINESIQLNRRALIGLTFNQQNVPGAIDAVWHQLSKMFDAVPNNRSKNSKVLGIWLGFPYVVGLRREGITKFLLYMLMAIMEQFPVDCELWTYSINEEEVHASFEALLNDFKNRVQIVTEKNYKEVLDIPSFERNLPFEINEVIDNLAYVAREYSKATCFVTAIVYLDNVISTGLPLFVPVHDLGIHSHYDDFVTKDPLYKARFVDIRSRAENFARADAFMFSNSEYIRREQVLKHISGINITNTDVVYLPVNIPRNLYENLLTEKAVRQNFGLKNPYIFYPTQIRPYKNVFTLVEALSVLRNRNIDIDLVLTGTPSDVPEVDLAIRRHKLNEKIICLPNVKENELYSLYRYAAVAAVPTLFEGGFPWQACEALFMNTPLVLSDIPVVRERIEFCGMSLEDCGLELFDALNAEACADSLTKIIGDREKAVASQHRFKEIFLEYTWNDAAVRYYNLFFGRNHL